MPSSSKPSDFSNLVLTSSATLCDRFKAVLLSLPSKLYDLANYILDADGNPSKDFAKDLLSNTGVWSVGDIKSTFSSSTPDGWIECEGQALDRTVYSLLFAAIGENHGSGDGDKTFNVPDIRARAVVGRNESTNQEGDFSVFPFHTPSGSEDVEISEEQFPAHTHEVFTYARQDASGTGGSQLSAADFKTYNDKLYSKGNDSIGHENAGHTPMGTHTDVKRIGLDGYGVTSSYGTGDSLSLIQPCIASRFLIYSGYYAST